MTTPDDAVPAVLVLANDATARSQAGDVAAAIGATVAGAAPLGDADALVAQHPQAVALFADLRDVDEAAAEPVLELAQRMATKGALGIVLLLSPDLIDLAAGLAPHEAVALLCDPAPAQIAAELGLSTHRRVAAAAHAPGPDAQRMRALSEEISRLARALATLTDQESAARAPLSGHPPDSSSEDAAERYTPSARMLRAIIRGRRLRDNFFGAELFADPAWDMLLDLMAARLEGGSVAVSSLCIAAAVPATTALRWIKSLTDEGWLVRVPDPHDGRRFFIALSDRAAEAMTAYLAMLSRAGMIGE